MYYVYEKVYMSCWTCRGQRTILEASSLHLHIGPKDPTLVAKIV